MKQTDPVGYYLYVFSPDILWLLDDEKQNQDTHVRISLIFYRYCVRPA